MIRTNITMININPITPPVIAGIGIVVDTIKEINLLTSLFNNLHSGLTVGTIEELTVLEKLNSQLFPV